MGAFKDLENMQVQNVKADIYSNFWMLVACIFFSFYKLRCLKFYGEKPQNLSFFSNYVDILNYSISIYFKIR